MSIALLQQRIHTALSQEYCRRLLIRYFVNKGFTESFDKRIYPPSIQDMAAMIPQLSGKIEIEPFVEDIDPNLGLYKLGWNLFVLGTRRLYLGESTHTSLAEVKSSIGGPLDGTNKAFYATPNRIVKFVSAILGQSNNGEITSRQLIRKAPMIFSTGDHSGYFKTQQRPVL